MNDYYDFYKDLKVTMPSQSITITTSGTDYVSPISVQEQKDAVRMALDARDTFSKFIAKLPIMQDKLCMHNSIKKVIFNNPATIVIWVDGTKTVVKCEGEKFDPEKGLAMAISKKLLGNNQGYYYDVFRKWLPKKKKHSKKEVIKAVKKVRENFDIEQAKKNK